MLIVFIGLLANWAN